MGLNSCSTGIRAAPFPGALRSKPKASSLQNNNLNNCYVNEQLLTPHFLRKKNGCHYRPICYSSV